MICKVCKRYFRAKAENKYLVTEELTPIETIIKRTRTFECFDCPKCGCQNMVNIREGTIQSEAQRGEEYDVDQSYTTEDDA